MGLIILAVFFAMATTSFGNPQQATQMKNPAVVKDCAYNVNKNVTVSTIAGDMRVQSSDKSTAPSYSTVPVPYQQVFGNKKWVNIKNNVSIPRFKVWNGLSDNPVHREMDLIGNIIENGAKKWVFAAIGHCENATDPNCLDPVTGVIIFVLQKKGQPLDVNLPEWIMIKNGANGVPVPPDNPDPEYWNFNVYLQEELLIANGGADYSNADVPCWLAQCRGGDIRSQVPGINPSDWNLTCRALIANRNGTPIPTAIPHRSASTAQPLTENDIYPPSFIKKSWVNVTGITDPGNWGDAWLHVQEYSWLAGKVTDLPGQSSQNHVPVNMGSVQGKMGVNDETFQVYALRQDTSFDNSIVFLQPLGHPTGYYYEYHPIQARENVQSESDNTLKLGTIHTTRDYVYEWWYPSCKPAVYIYPQTEQSFDISLKPFGFLTKSDPSYPLFGKWQNVLAKPNGQLNYLGNNYDYLYYEGKAFFVKVPPTAFTVKSSELDGFFTALMPQLGLNEKETADFKEYWLDRLNGTNDYYAISILPRQEIDRTEKMEISPLPDSLIRVRLFIRKLSEPKTFTLPYIYKPADRSGTTVVDWGGFYK